MKIDANKKVDIVLEKGTISVSVNGKLACRRRIGADATLTLGALVGILKKEGVLVS